MSILILQLSRRLQLVVEHLDGMDLVGDLLLQLTLGGTLTGSLSVQLSAQLDQLSVHRLGALLLLGQRLLLFCQLLFEARHGVLAALHPLVSLNLLPVEQLLNQLMHFGTGQLSFLHQRQKQTQGDGFRILA